MNHRTSVIIAVAAAILITACQERDAGEASSSGALLEPREPGIREFSCEPGSPGQVAPVGPVQSDPDREVVLVADDAPCSSRIGLRSLATGVVDTSPAAPGIYVFTRAARLADGSTLVCSSRIVPSSSSVAVTSSGSPIWHVDDVVIDCGRLDASGWSAFATVVDVAGDAAAWLQDLGDQIAPPSSFDPADEGTIECGDGYCNLNVSEDVDCPADCSPDALVTPPSVAWGVDSTFDPGNLFADGRPDDVFMRAELDLHGAAPSRIVGTELQIGTLPFRRCPEGYNVILGTEGDDVLTGTSGDDCIIGNGGADEIDGLDGDDVLSGGDGDDRIVGGPGIDAIHGGRGDDDIDGTDGPDSVDGGEGDDMIRVATPDSLVRGNDGNDTCWGALALISDPARPAVPGDEAPCETTCLSDGTGCTAACEPSTCEARQCGTIDDGCGTPLDCGVCDDGLTCSPDGLCVATSSDADAGAPDAGAPDAGAPLPTADAGVSEPAPMTL